jgi:putative inorganic carbon (hco3(-)) transporter
LSDWATVYASRSNHLETKLLWLEPLWIALLGLPLTLPGRFLPIAWHPYVVGLLFLFWPIRWLLTAQRVGQFVYGPSSPLTVPVLILVAWLPINLWAAADPTTAWIAAGYLLFGLTLYVSLLHWPFVRTHPERLAWALLALGSGLAVVALPFVEWKPQFRLFYLPLYDRLSSIPLDVGETIHANVLAGALVMVFPLLLALVLQQGWTSRRAVWLLCSGLAFILFVLIVLTQSRGGYLALATTLLTLLLLRWPRLVYATPLVFLGLIGAVSYIPLTTILNAFSTDVSLGGWEGRLDVWTKSYHALSDFVFTGIGIGTFTRVIPLFYPLQNKIEDFPHAHNLLLQIGLDMGLPGLIAYLALLFNLLVMVSNVLRRRSRNSLHWALAAGAFGSLMALLTHGLLDAVTWGTKLAFMPWLLYALITLLFLYTHEQPT